MTPNELEVFREKKRAYQKTKRDDSQQACGIM